MNLFFTELDSCMTAYIALPVVGISGFFWSGVFFRSASLCGVFPLNVIRGIVQSLLF